jgi:hypothetical protein
MVPNPQTPQSKKQSPVEGMAPIPAGLPALGVLPQTQESEELFWGDQIALQVWLACSVLLWLLGLCSVFAGLSQ